MRIEHEGHMQKIEEAHGDKVAQLSQYYRAQIEGKQKLIMQCKNEIEEHGLGCNSDVIEIEEDIEKEILQLQYRYEIKLRDEKIACSSVSKENTSMKMHYSLLSNEIEEGNKELAKATTEEKRLQGIIYILEMDIKGLFDEVRCINLIQRQERDDTILDKEKRIYDLRKKNQELEKFKFVLDYKIIELCKQIEPREQDIVNLTSRTSVNYHLCQEMKVELKNYQANLKNLENEYQDVILKHCGALRGRMTQVWRRKYVAALKKGIEQEVQQLHNERKNFQQFKVALL